MRMTAYISQCFLSHAKQTKLRFDWQFFWGALEFYIHSNTRVSGKFLAFCFKRRSDANIFEIARMKLICHGPHILAETDDFFTYFAHSVIHRGSPLQGFLLLDLKDETRQSLVDVVVQLT